jgi:hypothetical protein
VEERDAEPLAAEAECLAAIGGPVIEVERIGWAVPAMAATRRPSMSISFSEWWASRATT